MRTLAGGDAVFDATLTFELHTILAEGFAQNVWQDLS
jgi:hypothetical protein